MLEGCAMIPIKQLIAAYAECQNVRAVAAQFGCSFQNVAQRLRTAGVALRPAHYTSKYPALELRTCPTCEATFKPTSRAQRFCGLPCVRHKQYCKRGHLLTEETRYHFHGSASRCKECRKLNDKAYRARKAAGRC